MKEAVDVKKVIKDLQGNFDKDNEAQLKGVELLKGLATSDDPMSNEFMKKLNVVTTEISKEILGEVSENKKLKRIVVPEGKEYDLGSVVLEEGEVFYTEIKEGRNFRQKVGIDFQSDFGEDEEYIEERVHEDIADFVEQGYWQGQLFGEEPYFQGWWEVKIQEDDNDAEIREREVARLIREGYTSGYYPTFTMRANIWE